ncbi:MAG TPA: Nudix family hydrolase [Gammaproteobacteria bacterium]|nr:Nudix family hydrolase [Gammaproteobacteria bacterium]
MGAPGPSMPSIEVVAAVLRDSQGRVLIADRPAGRPLAGYWEFPGGKLEAGEATAAALKRELREELGIDVQRAHRLLHYSHSYPERHVQLDVWRVTRYQGRVTAREGQELAWVAPQEMDRWKLLPADGPIVEAIMLPPCMLVTPEPGDDSHFLAALKRSLEAGVDFVQFRATELDKARYGQLARRVIGLCRERGVRVHLNTTPETALELGADGVHLSQARLRSLAAASADTNGLALGISCHTADEIARALEHHPAYLSLGAVAATGSHPGMAPLGWQRFSALAAASPVPVYAIGGMQPADLEEARRRGGHGIAAIRGLWDLDQFPESS